MHQNGHFRLIIILIRLKGDTSTMGSICSVAVSTTSLVEYDMHVQYVYAIETETTETKTDLLIFSYKSLSHETLTITYRYYTRPEQRDCHDTSEPITLFLLGWFLQGCKWC